MDKPVIMVTGAGGQLGRELKQIAGNHPGFSFLFLSREDLAIEDAVAVDKYFAGIKPAYCINCAAYTAVDRAETEREQAMLINGKAVGTLAAACRRSQTRLIHLSTDYVFDGTAREPYTADAATSPVNYYGATKLEGEERCRQHAPDSIIIRTSWVYSEFGNNFVKTMMRLMSERESVSVVDDQFGSPTYAADLAGAILDIIGGACSGRFSWQGGIFNYCNKGVINWYSFAQAIREYTGSTTRIIPIPSSAYPTAAKRPAFSVLDTRKIQAIYYLSLHDWKESLSRCISRLANYPTAREPH